MARLPDILSTRDLPYSELCAARLDGELYRLDDTFSPVDGLDQPRLRALSVGSWAPAGLIAERRTAAWIYGALDDAPLRHQFCVDTAARVRPDRSLRFAVREVVLGAGDIVQIDGVRLTAPIRTVIDLARIRDDRADDIPELISRLAAGWRLTVEQCRELLDRRRNLPGKREALAMITAAL